MPENGRNAQQRALGNSEALELQINRAGGQTIRLLSSHEVARTLNDLMAFRGGRVVVKYSRVTCFIPVEEAMVRGVKMEDQR